MFAFLSFVFVFFCVCAKTHLLTHSLELRSLWITNRDIQGRHAVFMYIWKCILNATTSIHEKKILWCSDAFALNHLHTMDVFGRFFFFFFSLSLCCVRLLLCLIFVLCNNFRRSIWWFVFDLKFLLFALCSRAQSRRIEKHKDFCNFILIFFCFLFCFCWKNKIYKIKKKNKSICWILRAFRFVYVWSLKRKLKNPAHHHL